MARAIELIERDIAVLQEAIRAIASELHNAYTSYLTILGQALRKQLILASYHLCTQGYPEKFLSLSLNQRQQLQQAIRNLGGQTSELLLTFIQGESDEEDEEDGENEEEVVDEGDEEDVDEIGIYPSVGDDEDEDEEDVTENEIEASSRGEDELGEADKIVAYFLAESSALPVINVPLRNFTPDASNPMELAKWQQNLENLVQQALKNVSHDANLLLQKANVLPKKLPKPILEAAAAVSEASAEVMPGPPNLLNLVVEIENEQNAEESGLTRIMAINLRLGEIEFADTKLASSRRQIRNILVQLNKLGREYRKKQRERSVAEAESAWRASWFE
ncbi:MULTISPECIES: hypothetical protein [unclassified Anabaena]|uniref:hypothetical protein n=1 Tax=unclassified Anabaena TaxID=2619674 RepID=UPI0039C6B3E4